MAISPLIVNNFIDSCAFDPKYEPETTAANELHELANDGVLPLEIAHSTQKEIEHPNTPQWVKERAAELNYTIEVSLTEGERTVLKDLRLILAGNGNVENIIQDAQHVFETQKYGHYFVTTDNRILAKASGLRARCGVKVMLPSKFLALVKSFLEERE